MTTQSASLKRLVLTLVAATVCGALAGAAAGFTASTIIPEIPISKTARLAATSTTVAPTAPTSTFALVPLKRRAIRTLVPPAFAKRGVSSVVSIYHKPKGVSLKSRLLTKDRLIGRAVVLTSDGWLVADAAAINGTRLVNLTVWINGQSYNVSRGFIDHLDNVAFLKTSATGLTPTAFAYVRNLLPGDELWIEARAGELEPSVTLSTTARTGTNPVSSEKVSRRIIVDGVSKTGDRGGAVWDPNGSLVGLIDSTVGERVSLIPASVIAVSFTSLLSNGEIRHAQLGVRTVDLADLRINGSRDGLPDQGALIQDNTKTGKFGVMHNLAASKAGLKAGDVILRVEHDTLDGSADLGEVLADYQPGTHVTLRVLRDGSDMDIPVTLGETITSEVMK